MKAGLYKIRAVATMVILLCAGNAWLIGQALPQIHARFTNPRYEVGARKYTLDVELQSSGTQEFLFGMNMRFFYDASLLEFQSVKDFHPGYSLLGDAPKPFVGNETSGIQLFGFSRAAAYINGAVQLKENGQPVEIVPNKWVKVFSVTFRVPENVTDVDRFCPSVIWDLKPTTGDGGFLPGGDGLVITVTENNRSTRQESMPTISKGVGFNWQYDHEAGLPYGQPESRECVSILELVSNEDPDQVDALGYALFQNQPNPFDGKTIIEFILPFAQEATITFYNVNGVQMEQIKGEFSAGKNQLLITQKPWMVQSNTMYYRLQAENYTSRPRKMALVRA
jgi:hypothetical protein